MTLDYTFERQIMLERKEGHKEGLEEGLEKGHKALISTCRELGVSFEETASRVKEKFSLSNEEAEKSMQLYW